MGLVITLYSLQLRICEYLEALMREARGALATKADLTELRAELEKQIASLGTAFKTDIAEAKIDLSRWMFLFWIGPVAAVFGLIKFLFPAL